MGFGLKGLGFRVYVEFRGSAGAQDWGSGGLGFGGFGLGGVGLGVNSDVALA